MITWARVTTPDWLQLEIFAYDIGDRWFAQLQQELKAGAAAEIVRSEDFTTMYSPPPGTVPVHLKFLVVIASLPDGDLRGNMGDTVAKLVKIITSWLRRVEARYREVYIFGPDRFLTRALTFCRGIVQEEVVPPRKHIREMCGW